jgi:transcriptional regulator with XRE-family HTH domain
LLELYYFFKEEIVGMEKENNPLPKLLRHYREKQKMTQLQVAQTLGVSRAGYANYEEGRSIPSVDQIIKLSSLLKHDFLFAYTMAFEYGNADKNSSSCVSDVSTYNTEDIYQYNVINFLSGFRQLPYKEQKLIQTYIAQKINNSEEQY